MRKMWLGLLLGVALLLFPASARGQDYLLLHSGDALTVSFGPNGGTLQVMSLSERSRLDLTDSASGTGKWLFNKNQKWVTFPGTMAGRTIRLKLREDGGGIGTAEMPGDSDVVVRVSGGTVSQEVHTDTAKRGTKCSVCNAKLDW